MLLIAYFQHKLNSSFTWVKGDALTHVLHLNDIGAIAGTHVQYSGKGARAVGKAYKDGEAAALVGFVAAHKVGDEADVDVAAGKHDASAACFGWCYLLSE